MRAGIVGAGIELVVGASPTFGGTNMRCRLLPSVINVACGVDGDVTFDGAWSSTADAGVFAKLG